VPTFPNAEYLFNSADFEFWNPANGHPRRGELMNMNVFEDSVAPVHQAGQATLWADEHTIDENLTLRAAPGHTPRPRRARAALRRRPRGVRRRSAAQRDPVRPARLEQLLLRGPRAGQGVPPQRAVLGGRAQRPGRSRAPRGRSTPRRSSRRATDSPSRPGPSSADFSPAPASLYPAVNANSRGAAVITRPAAALKDRVLLVLYHAAVVAQQRGRTAVRFCERLC